MVVIDCDKPCYFDVDQTLIFWDETEELKNLGLPKVKINGREFLVHTEHVRKIEEYLTLGLVVYVWSNSGYKWAEKVCKAIIKPNYLEMITLVACAKPYRCFDNVKDLGSSIRHGYMNPDASKNERE